jgi:hypothetical protein
MLLVTSSYPAAMASAPGVTSSYWADLNRRCCNPVQADVTLLTQGKPLSAITLGYHGINVTHATRNFFSASGRTTATLPGDGQIRA